MLIVGSTEPQHHRVLGVLGVAAAYDEQMIGSPSFVDRRAQFGNRLADPLTGQFVLLSFRVRGAVGL